MKYEKQDLITDIPEFKHYDNRVYNAFLLNNVKTVEDLMNFNAVDSKKLGRNVGPRTLQQMRRFKKEVQAKLLSQTNLFKEMQSKINDLQNQLDRAHDQFISYSKAHAMLIEKIDPGAIIGDKKLAKIIRKHVAKRQNKWTKIQQGLKGCAESLG